MRKIVLLALLCFAVLFMVACDTPTGNSIKNSESIMLKCTGETTAILQDYCVIEENRTIKFLIMNGFITELKHANIELTGDAGVYDTREDLLIEIEQQKIVEIKYPEYVGYPLKVKLTVYYFGNSGLERCIPEEIEYTQIRKCGQSAS
jgi:hypothetical protein